MGQTDILYLTLEFLFPLSPSVMIPHHRFKLTFSNTYQYYYSADTLHMN